jgi:S1-C subfamily serine protease
MMRTQLRRFSLAAAAALLLTVGAACSSNESPTVANGSGDAPNGIVTQPPRPASNNNAPTLSAADLVRAVEPAVVRIQAGTSVGSGFIISTDGHIITNSHVITSAGTRVASTIDVTLSDGAVHRAAVVGNDPRADLAVLKIDVSNLVALPLANLADVIVGEDVIAIGYALDLSGGEGPAFTVTRGIVSAKNRGITETAFSILGAVQTDAAINRGNSGGPLLNLKGEVIGVNTALAPDASTGGIAAGIGFAVGSDTVRAVYEEIRETGRVERGLFGIAGFEALRPAQARELGIPNGTGGVYLGPGATVSPGGPAASAGIRTGDVISKIGDFNIRSEADLAVAMIRQQPGETVTVELYRSGQKITVEVTLGSNA